MNATLKNQARAIFAEWPLISTINATLMLAAMAAIDYETAAQAIAAVVGK